MADAKIKKNSEESFDTLVLSSNKQLYIQISEYLGKSEPSRKVHFSSTLQTLLPIETTFKTCNLFLCDLNTTQSTLQAECQLLDQAPLEMLPIGLSDGMPLPDNFHALPYSFRLAKTIDIKEGWKDVWQQIHILKDTWNNPLMISKIEEVPVSDILQMISTGRWNSIVKMHGVLPVVLGNEQNPPERMRGCISFWKGEPYSAWSLHHTGNEAVYDLLSATKGVLKVIRLNQVPAVRNIHLEMHSLLLSYAVSLDESGSQDEVFFTMEQPENGEQTIPQGPETATELHHEDVIIPQKVTPIKENNPEQNKEPSPQTPVPDSQEPVLSSWWSKDMTQLCSTLMSTEPRSLPLRWMNHDDLQRFADSDTKSEFIILHTNKDALAQILGLCARDFTTDKLEKDQVPVIRLTRSQGTHLYLIGHYKTATQDIFKTYPSALYVPGEPIDTILSQVNNCGHRICILLAPLGEEEIYALIKNNIPSEIVLRIIQAPLLRWDSIANTLVSIIKIISDIATGIRS